MATVYSRHGTQAAQHHKDSIAAFSTPQAASDVKSFLGLATFMQQYIPDMATKTAPLRKLLHKGQQWDWSSDAQAAFDSIKADIAADRVLAFFDRDKHTHLYVDASPVGLGVILCQSPEAEVANHQDIKPIAFASRSLSQTEQRYSQTERETLAVKYGCLRFYHFLCGDPSFTVHTDHKPLLHLLHPSSHT